MSVWIQVVSKSDRYASNTLTLRYVGTRPSLRILSPSVGYGERTKMREIPFSFVVSKSGIKNFTASDLVSTVSSDIFENFHQSEHDARIYSAVLRLDTNISGARSVYVNESAFNDNYGNEIYRVQFSSSKLTERGPRWKYIHRRCVKIYKMIHT